MNKFIIRYATDGISSSLYNKTGIILTKFNLDEFIANLDCTNNINSFIRRFYKNISTHVTSNQAGIYVPIEKNIGEDVILSITSERL